MAAAEQMFGRKVGLKLPVPHPGEPEVVAANRDAILQWCAASATASPLPAAATGPSAWPPRYAGRRLIWHVLDHAWEVEDRSS